MRFLVVVLIIGVALAPLVELRGVMSGATAGKIMLFRALIEGALFLCVLRIFFGKKKPNTKEVWKALKRPVALTLILFLLSMAVSAIFSVNPGRAFWGTIERGEGIFGMFHYIALFFFVAVLLTHKERLILLKLFLVSGYILVWYGFREASGGLFRITSYIGNAAFFAGHLLFLIAVAWIVMQESKKKGVWWYIALCFIPLAIVGIIMTGTRGAILGLGIGSIILLFTWAVRGFGKKVLWAIAGVCIVGSISIWLGSGRMWAFVGERSNSIQTRLMFWETGWRAFQEKPLIGWGPEHFILASSAHYNPKAARHGETWFDRAHNKILDILVSQGVIGLLVFMGLLGSVLFAVWRDTTHKKPLTLTFGSAYLVQTMFAPDQIVSWIGIMVFLGYIVGGDMPAEEVGTKEKSTRPCLVERIGAAGVGAIAAVALYYGNALPYMQLKTFFEAKGAEDPTPLLKRVFAKNTFVRAEAETNLIDFYTENRPDLIVDSHVGSIVRNESRALAAKEPQDIRNGIRYIRVLLEQAQHHPPEADGAGQAQENNALYYNEAELELEELAKVAPKRQEIYYLLALVLGREEKIEEAIQAAKHAVELAPEVARAHYVLGVALVLSENEELKKQAEKELIKAEELDPTLDSLQGSDIVSLIKIYESRKRWDRIADMALRRANGVISWTTLSEQIFVIALFHFATEKNKDAFIEVGTYVEEHFPEQKNEMREILELAEQEKWEIIQSMFEVE